MLIYLKCKTELTKHRIFHGQLKQLTWHPQQQIKNCTGKMTIVEKGCTDFIFPHELDTLSTYAIQYVNR